MDIDEATLEVIARVRRPYLEAALEAIDTEFGEFEVILRPLALVKPDHRTP